MFKSLIDDSEISRKVYFAAFSIILLTSLLAFSNIISGDFVADDIAYIVDNEVIKSLFNSDIFFYKQTSFARFNNYRPVYFFALAIEYTFFDLNPVGYHLVNIFLHAINCFLLYSLTIKYTNAKLLALITALLFAVHPIHTEVVSNITGFSEILTAFFLFLAIWSYSYSKGLDRYYLASLICSLLGIMSKENGVILLGIIILIDTCSNWSNLANLRKKFIYYLGYFLTILVYLSIKLSIKGTLVTNKTVLVFDEAPITVRIYTMSLVFMEYFRLLIWPNKLIAFYDTFIIPIIKEPSFAVIMAFCLIIGLLVIGIALLWYQRIAAFAILFFFGTISIASNVFFDTGVIMAERFLYIPSLGICLLIALLLYFLINKQNSLKFLGIGLLILILFGAITRTYIRNLDWLNKDSVRLAFLRDAPQSPRGAMLQYEKTVDLFNSGQREASIELSKEIVRQYPNYAQVYCWIGTVLQLEGNHKEALPYFSKAKELRPNNLEMRTAYATSLLNNGILLEAKTELEAILQLDPNSAKIHNYLGAVYLNLQLYSQAQGEFETALRLDPNYKAAEINLLKLYETIQIKPKK